MAAGDVRQGLFSRVQADGRATIASLIGGTTYYALKVRVTGPTLIGNSAIDPAGAATAQGYRLHENDILQLENTGITGGEIDGAKLNVFAVNGDHPVAVDILAIDNV